MPDDGHDRAGAASDLLSAVEALDARVRRLEASLDERSVLLDERLDGLADALRFTLDDDGASRRRVRDLRDAPDYESAFTDDQPLVSVVIATWTNLEGVLNRSVPSALAQTHENVEVIVVGDASPEPVVDAVEALGDPRVHFENLTVRGPYDRLPFRAWMSAGTPGFNTGIAAASGRWIAPLGDDDAFDADHVERLLARARETRAEYVCSRVRMSGEDGAVHEIGTFPPEFGRSGVQCAMWHAGLRFMEFELAHALLNVPNDWGLIHRMMRAGVRMAAVDAATVDYLPSRGGERALGEGRTPPWERGGVEERDTALQVAHQEIEELEGALRDARRRDAEGRRELGELQEHAAGLGSDLEAARSRHAQMVGSRAWRAMSALRRIRGD